MTQRNSPLKSLAVIDGIRTPFAKSFGQLGNVSADELGRIAVEALMKQIGIEPMRIDEVIFGCVAGPADASNIARVIALKSGVPFDRIAHTVNRNCASGMEAIISSWQAIRDGRSEVVIAGGTESMSNVPLLWNRRFTKWLIDLSKQKSLPAKLMKLLQVRPGFFKPVPAIKLGLTDPTCGLNMGQTAEILAREFNISREQQDAFALTSHEKALAAWERCFFKDEVVPVIGETTGSVNIDKDDGPRPGQSLKALAKLKPVFERETGTVTVGNTCPITDGAAAILLTSPEKANDFDGTPLGYVTAYSIAGCDPRRMGLGPVFAIDKLLKQTGLALADFDLIEINEAFAAQILACGIAIASDEFAKKELGRDSAIGELDFNRLNVNGGAIALGHPVGTTGTRLVLTLLRALREKGLKRGLATLCIGGGQGAAVCVETTLEK